MHWMSPYITVYIMNQPADIWKVNKLGFQFKFYYVANLMRWSHTLLALTEIFQEKGKAYGASIYNIVCQDVQFAKIQLKTILF